MKREIGKLTVLITAPILLSLVWNIHASDTRLKTAQLDTISVPHTVQLDSLSKALSDSLGRRIKIFISERSNPNARDLLLRPADKATYTTSDLLLRPDDKIIYIPISTTKHRPAKKEKSK